MQMTEFVSHTNVFDEFESHSPTQRHYSKTYATGLVAGRNKTVADIVRKSFRSRKHALNKLLPK